MKTKIFTLLTGICLSFASCNTDKNSSTVHAIITGKVNVNWSNTLKLATGPVTLTDSWIDRLNIGDTIINLQNDGTFYIQLPIDKADFMRLSHESKEVEIFISPGDSLFVDLTSEMVFSGKGGALNNHLSSLRDTINANRRYINSIEFYNQSPDRVNAILDSLKSAYLNTHKSFADSHTVNERFERKVRADITYRHKLYKVVHPAWFEQINKERLPVEETYFEDLAAGSFDQPELLKSLDYVLFLDEYLNAQAAGAYKFGNYFDAPVEKIHPKYEQIQQLKAHQDIKDYLLLQHLQQSMDNYGVAYLQDLIPAFREDCKTSLYIERVEDQFNAGMERRREPSEIKIYKTHGNVELEAHIFYPEGHKTSDKTPAYLFFHGGGWEIGIPEWGYKNCARYQARGMVAISFEYRIMNIHKSNLLDCVRDAKSAVLWTRKEAQSLGIDPERIVAAGFSAGGHLAACTAILNEYEEPDAGGISSKPNAIIVHSASYNTLKKDWFSRNSEQKAATISTFHQLGKGLVHSIFFHGTEDHLAPISEFTEFRDKMDSLGNDYEYKIFENTGHFFNNPTARKEVDEMTEDFLAGLGYIEPHR